MKCGLKKLYISILFTGMLLFLFQGFLLAQTTGNIAGRVTDAVTRERLPGANIIVEGTSFGAATNKNGDYLIRNLPPGTYTLRASYTGYATARKPNIKVNENQTTQADFKMSSGDIFLCVEKCNITIDPDELHIRLKICNKSSTALTNVILEIKPVDIYVCEAPSTYFTSINRTNYAYYDSINPNNCGSAKDLSCTFKEYRFGVNNLYNTNLWLCFKVCCHMNGVWNGCNYVSAFIDQKTFSICQHIVVSKKRKIAKTVVRDILFGASAFFAGWLLNGLIKKKNNS